MRRALLAILSVLALANCDAVCFRTAFEKICPGDPCAVGESDEYCVHSGDKLYCAADGMYDTAMCDSCASLYDPDRRLYVAVCKR